MMKHADVWKAVDKLAQAYGYSASGLARQAGLDPTTFNKSKRTTREGKERWPSTESIAKILKATGADLSQFTAYIQNGETPTPRNVPLIGFAQAGAEGFFDDAGYPTGGGWDAVPIPGTTDGHAYALEISGDSMDPVFRDGDIVIVSPEADIRRGDRVVVKTSGGEVMAKVLLRKTAQRIELGSFNPDHENREFALADIDWMARIIWAQQ
ncbi:helix-turn-helix transcriptional regulator [Magnetovibrio sp. PR-2]|uniref:S24 family peptidase n=1 Tax=Magnetovibrio sp. PR-2 TaxID=3120356 RepID=UPI002FCE2821